MYAVGSLVATGYLYNTVSEVKADRDSLTQELQKTIKERDTFLEQSDSLKKDKTILEKSNKDLQASVDTAKKDLDKLKKEIKGLKGDLTEQEKENKELQTQISYKKEQQRKAEEAEKAKQAEEKQKAEEERVAQEQAKAQAIEEELESASEPVAVSTPVQESAPQGRTLVMESTAYSSDPADALGGGTVTATGQNLLSNPIAVAVDPNVIPLGTKLHVEGYGTAYAVDTGGAIRGNIIDVHFPTYSQCINWGRRQVTVTILS